MVDSFYLSYNLYMSIALLILLALLFIIGTTLAMVWAAQKEEKDKKK